MSKLHHIIFVGILAAGSATSAFSEIIPAARLVDWTAGVATGVPGGIPTNRTTIIDVTQAPYNANKTGASDATSAIQSAVDAAAANSVVYLPAGTYRINGTINLNKSNITLRGAGESTIIDYRGSSQRAIFMGIDTDWPWPTTGTTITGGMTKGSTTLTMASTADFSANQMIRIAQDNDLALPVVTVFANPRMRIQTTRVVSKTSTSLTIFPGLYWGLDAAKSPQAHPFLASVSGIGLEDMRIDGTNSTGPRIIDVWQTYGCWLKNIHTIKASNYHIYLLTALQCEVRHCFADQLKNQGSNGAGLLIERSSANLIEDNILYASFPHIEVNYGCSGNVFAYNLCELNDVYSSIMGASIDSNHGAHNSFNLYEGNVSSMFQCDGYFGSASDDTLFRNRFHGTNDNGTGTSNKDNSKCIDLDRFSRRMNVVGNVLGMPQSYWTAKAGYPIAYERTNSGFGYNQPTIFRLGFPNMGNNGYSGTVQPSAGTNWADWLSGNGQNAFQERDLDVAATIIRKGNWNAADQAVPASESLGSDTLPASMYRSGKPSWFGSLAWPAFDPATPVITVQSAFAAIPAGYRFLNNGADPTPGSPTPPTAPSALTATP